MGNAGHHRHGAATADPDAAILAAGGYAVLAKYRWRTPPEVIADLVRRYGKIDIDACAGPENAVAPLYIDAELDCLSGLPWNEAHKVLRLHGNPGGDTIYTPGMNWPMRHAFMNSPWDARGVRKAAREAFPDVEVEPFPGTAAFALEALRQHREHGLDCTVLLPNATDTKWQTELIEHAAQILVGRRFGYLDHHGIRQTSPPGGSVVLHFSDRVFDERVVWGWKP